MSVLASIGSMDSMMNVSKTFLLKDCYRLMLCFGDACSDSCTERISVFCECALKLLESIFQTKVRVTLENYLLFCCP